MAVITRAFPAQRVRTITNALEAFLDDAEDRRRLRQNTVSAYHSDLLAVAAILTVPLDTISLTDIEAFSIGRQEAPATSNRRIAASANSFGGSGVEARHRSTLHQLRHTVASELIKVYPEHIVSRVLGHRDPRSTRRYAEVNEDQVRAVLAGKRR